MQNGGSFVVGKGPVALLLMLAFGKSISMNSTNQEKQSGGSRSPPTCL